MATIQSYSDEIEREILKQQIDVEYSYAGQMFLLPIVIDM